MKQRLANDMKIVREKKSNFKGFPNDDDSGAQTPLVVWFHKKTNETGAKMRDNRFYGYLVTNLLTYGLRTFCSTTTEASANLPPSSFSFFWGDTYMYPNLKTKKQ